MYENGRSCMWLSKRTIILILILAFDIFAQYEWSTPLQLSRNGVWPELMIGYPAITVDSNGVIYAFWAISLEIDGDWSNGWYSQIEYRKSNDGGLTWTATQNITPEYTDLRIYAIEAVCDSQNNVHIVYFRGSGNCKIIYKKFDGITWSTPSEVSSFATTRLRFAIDSTDKMYVTWFAGPDDTGSAYYSCFIDSWSVPQLITTEERYAILNIKISNDENLHATGYSKDLECPYYFLFNKNENNWTKFEQIFYNGEISSGCTLAVTDDSLYVNVAVGPYICLNTDNHLQKNTNDSLWLDPILFGDNNAWDREMFIDKNGVLHLFEKHYYQGDTNGDTGLIHSENKNGVWTVESIDSLHNFSYSEPNIAFDKINGKCYLAYAKSDRLRSITRIYFQTKQITTGINDPDENIPETAVLFQNYPNPFNNSTKISYSINKPAIVKVNIFNTKGEFLQSLINKKQNKGQHSVIFNVDNLNSGIYYYQLEVDGRIEQTKKMLYLK